MKKNEVVELLSIFKVAYPKFFISTDNEELDLQIRTWAGLLKEYPYWVVKKAAYNLIRTLKFPPTIADIIESVRKIMHPEILTEQEAWHLVQKALENGYYNSQKEFDKLPKILQRVVGSPSQLKQWSIMELDAVQSVVASNVQRSYRVLAQREQEEQITNPMLKSGAAQLENKKESNLEIDKPEVSR